MNEDVAGHIWPSSAYAGQIERLRGAVGQTIFLVELEPTQIQLGIRQTGQPYILLDILEFPQPDPVRGLAPHLILLDDGRGVNLGRIARISLEQPFNPTPEQVIYQDRRAARDLLFAERDLSQTSIAERSRQLLRQVLGMDAARSEPAPSPALEHRRRSPD
ncbi:hypothetical protein [Thiocapsa bogorovii]|uniref:hypothetical protein n=1 Tax=Thiocapsa bogorovii TaxID=521689 RepID=UPI001E65D060|nr:hypothetical protein [Thiocapsa bogorovii]UHD16076.1 hypothetical protein LT988_22970 [Thiocapsa bogorovii]